MVAGECLGWCRRGPGRDPGVRSASETGTRYMCTPCAGGRAWPDANKMEKKESMNSVTVKR
jgi:hypothetical protein